MTSSGAILRAAWACYRRHVAVVVGLSLVGSVQRVVLQLWGRDWPLWVSGALELVVAAARIALVVFVFRVLIAEDDRLRDLDLRDGVRRVGRFARLHWRTIVVQVALFAVAFVVFDRLPETAISTRVPASAQPAWWAALLAIKNPTIIAFTIVWQIALLRHALLLGGDGPGAEPRAGAGQQRGRLADPARPAP